jgi:hypothetical protein
VLDFLQPCWYSDEGLLRSAQNITQMAASRPQYKCGGSPEASGQDWEDQDKVTECKHRKAEHNRREENPGDNTGPVEGVAIRANVQGASGQQVCSEQSKLDWYANRS